jgi:hypothetical protein
VQLLQAGNYLTVAAQFTGVGRSTVQAWLARGRIADAALARGEEIPETERRYVEFLGAVTEAEVHAEVVAATAFRSFVTQDWRAARDFLRYRVPDRWRAVTTVNLRPEEAEQRIEHAVNEALSALGIEHTPSTTQGPDLGADTTADLLAELTQEHDDAEPED